MPQDLCSDQDPTAAAAAAAATASSDDTEPDFVEIDPSGRYGRYKDVLGRGAFKKVYRAFDEWEGIEVAWNQVKVSDLLRNSEDMERLFSEVHLLQTLKHKNIIKFFNSWLDTRNEHINFITEIFTSGTLRQYRKKHKHVDLRAVKKWSKQILEGLLYLHCHDPPVIHRDLKCDNIFVNGNQGEVKIGDLGLAAMLRHARAAHSVIGTPEFMAPELYEEEYNELVDIYAFGMCLLELVTLEYPYVECANAAQIYKKVVSGVKPASLAKVTDPAVKEFIEKCISNVGDRLSADELLKDPFLHSDDDNDSVGRSLRLKNVQSGIYFSLDTSDCYPIIWLSHFSITAAASSVDQLKTSQNAIDSLSKLRKEVTLEGHRKDMDIIFLKLRIADHTGHSRNIHFPFDVEKDTSIAVASEMVEELNLTDQDVLTIAAMIDSEIQSHIPEWEPSDLCVDSFGISESYAPETKAASSPSPGLALERLPSGRKYWCDSPKGPGENLLEIPSPSNLTMYLDSLNLNGYDSFKMLNDEGDNRDGGNHGKKRGDFKLRDINTIGNVLRLRTQNSEIKDVEIDEVTIIARNLQSLMMKQQKEMDELKKKHESAISEFLTELSPEIREMVLNICKTDTGTQK
ncbi:hypothetical protein ACFE04_017564 [Oxalis oulophora]